MMAHQWALNMFFGGQLKVYDVAGIVNLNEVCFHYDPTISYLQLPELILTQ